MKSLRSELLLLLALFVLLGLNIGNAYLPLGPANLPIMLALCLASAAIVLCFFMELRKPEILFRLAIGVGIVWLAIFFAIVFTDYLTRGPGRLLG